MKKILVGLLALTSMTAFAQRHMVQLSGYEGNREDRSLDLFHSNGGATHNTSRNIALNYAFAVTNAVQVGAVYKNFLTEGAAKTETQDTTWGVFAIYNFAGRLTDTNYLGLKYTMANEEGDNAAGTKVTDTDTNTWSLEFGHRFTLGTLMGMNFNWSPSAEVGIATADRKSGDDISTTEVRLNVLKVDVLF